MHTDIANMHLPVVTSWTFSCLLTSVTCLLVRTKSYVSTCTHNYLPLQERDVHFCWYAFNLFRTVTLCMLPSMGLQVSEKFRCTDMQSGSACNTFILRWSHWDCRFAGAGVSGEMHTNMHAHMHTTCGTHACPHAEQVKVELLPK